MTVNFVFTGVVGKETRTNTNGTVYNWFQAHILGVTGGEPLARKLEAWVPLSTRQQEFVDVSDGQVHTGEATEGEDGRINLQINMVFENKPLPTFNELLTQVQTVTAPVEDAVSTNGDDLPF